MKQFAKELSSASILNVQDAKLAKLSSGAECQGYIVGDEAWTWFGKFTSAEGHGRPQSIMKAPKHFQTYL